MIDILFSFPLDFYFGLFLIILAIGGIQAIMRESADPSYNYQASFRFFKGISSLLTIIGAIVTVISLSPLFLTFFLGDDWFHILLTSEIGIQTLGAVIIAPFFAAFFIYCLLLLIVFRWWNQIFKNDEVRLSEKIISVTILVSGIIAIIFLVYFLFVVWFTRLNAPVSITGLVIIPLILSLFYFLVIGVLIDFDSVIPNYPIRIFYSIGMVLFFIVVTIFTVFPVFNGGITVYNTALNYTHLEKNNFSFQLIPLQKNNDTPRIVSIQPNLTDFPTNSINIDYVDCHWSTTYGYFITINSKNLFVQKRSNDFVIHKCILNQEEDVYWTYDISDYSKQKPSVIISLQIENSNRRLFQEKLGEATDFIVGASSQNFSWVDHNTIFLSNKESPFF